MQTRSNEFFIEEQEVKEFAFKNIEEYKEKFSPIKEFLITNRKYPEEYIITYLNNTLCATNNWKEKIRKIFINSLNTGAGNNLTNKGKACKNFYDIIETLPNDEIIDFGKFLNKFESKDLKSLFEHFTKSKDAEGNKKYLGLGKKVTALFIRDLDLMNKKIFNEYERKEDDLYIPVDRVIVFLIKKILKKSFKVSSFYEINEFAKQLLNEEYMLVEDLW